MVKAVISHKIIRGNQLGFTLVELIVAISISVLLMVGTVAILRYMVVQTGASGDRTMAQLQVQYVSSWISSDVVQAQRIALDNSSGNAILQKRGFPFTITWEGDDGKNITVVYDIVKNMGQNPWQLTREYKVNEVSEGTLIVSEYIVPWSQIDEEDEGTWCNIENAGSETEPNYVLVLDVAAKVDQSKESSTYEISPRYSGITWE